MNDSEHPRIHGELVIPKVFDYRKLLKAKQEFGPILKNKVNPHFKNAYADLESNLDGVEPALHKHGLLLVQPICDQKVISRIIDCENGGYIESSLDLPAALDAQKMGSAISYFRRYTLSSLVAVAAEDDDGNAVSTASDTKAAIQSATAILGAKTATKTTAPPPPTTGRYKFPFDKPAFKVGKYIDEFKDDTILKDIQYYTDNPPRGESSQKYLAALKQEAVKRDLTQSRQDDLGI